CGRAFPPAGLRGRRCPRGPFGPDLLPLPLSCSWRFPCCAPIPFRRPAALEGRRLPPESGCNFPVTADRPIEPLGLVAVGGWRAGRPLPTKKEGPSPAPLPSTLPPSTPASKPSLALEAAASDRSPHT